MGHILVWECEETQQLFREEKDYRAHRRSVARQRVAREKAEAKAAAELLAMQPLYACTNPQEVEEWIITNQDLIMKFTKRFSNHRPNSRLLAVKLLNLSYGEQSCSHNAPLGKPTNWCGRGDPLPNTYLGWGGRIELYYERDSGDFYDSLKAVGLCSGGGGGGGTWDRKAFPRGSRLSYEVTLWQDDFPLLPTDQLPYLLHDLQHFDRLPTEKRAREFRTLIDKTTKVARLGLGLVSDYCRLADVTGNEQLNYLARLFGNTPWHYWVKTPSEYRGRDEFQEMGRLRGKEEAMGLAETYGVPSHHLLTDVGAEAAIRWLMSGAIDEIIDLKERAARLCSQGLLTSLPEPSPYH